jgi:hypothetical protein
VRQSDVPAQALSRPFLWFLHMRPANRLETHCERFTWGPFDFYAHFDRAADGRVVQVAFTSKTKDGSQQQEFFRKLTVMLNRALQGRF